MLVGMVVYSVASLEGMLIFDLPRMPTVLPVISPETLAGRTTTTIGKQLVSLAGSVAEESWRRYLGRGGEALLDVGPRRNAVLHARPATIEGCQRLHRWRLHPTEVVSISSEYLNELLETIDVHRRELNALRPPIARR